MSSARGGTQIQTRREGVSLGRCLCTSALSGWRGGDGGGGGGGGGVGG